MVEFGLKLDDNKVADWADEYIDYEKLKAILDKLKSAMKKKEDLHQRKPDLADEVSQDFVPKFEGTSSLSARLRFENFQNKDTPRIPAIPPPPPEETSTSISDPTLPLVAISERSVNPEEQPLLTSNSMGSSYGRTFDSEVSLLSADGTGAEGGSTSSFATTLAGVASGYLPTARYQKQYRDQLKRIDELRIQGQEELVKEVAKVNQFYIKKAEELDKRLTVLVDSVDGPVVAAETRKTHRVRRSVAELVVTQLTQLKSMVNHQHSHSPHSSHQRPPHQRQHSYPLDRTPPLLMKKKVAKLLQDEEQDDVYAEDDPLMAQLRESESIQRALGDQYRMCKFLHNFAIMNYTGFVKIGKKFDKLCPDQKRKYKNVLKDANICNEGKEVEGLETRLEKVYADWFCEGNVREATAQLLPKRGDGLQMDWSQLRLGYRLGMCAILTLWVCWDCIWGLVRDGNSTIGGRIAFPVFRGCGGLLMLHWFWGVSVYIWTRFRVNYIFLFDLNPKTVRSPISIFNDAVDETLVFLVLMLLYYKAGAHDIPNMLPTGYFPAILVLYTLSCLIFPLRIRMPLWRTIGSVLMAPFVSPTFFTIYMADVFTSMIKVFQDFAWTACFLLSGDFLKSEDSKQASVHIWQNSLWYKNILIPLICLFPLWIRFNQCLRRYTDTGKRMPNLANALKYAMSQTVTLFGAFHPLYLMHRQHDEHGIKWFQVFWMALFVSSSLYSFFWDVFMDWGLGDAKFGYLSQRLMYPNRSTYYCVILLDIVLRFMWVLTLVPPQSGARFEIPQYLSAVTMGLELMRRTIWGFFRLENEHRSNTDQYRRVSFVPLHFSTGHQHHYNQGREHAGWTVLLEVGIVTAMVIAISISSVIAAQRATKDYSTSDP